MALIGFAVLAPLPHPNLESISLTTNFSIRALLLEALPLGCRIRVWEQDFFVHELLGSRFLVIRYASDFDVHFPENCPGIEPHVVMCRHVATSTAVRAAGASCTFHNALGT